MLMHFRPVSSADRSRLDELWAETFPQLDLPGPDFCALPAGSQAFVALHAGRVQAGAWVTVLNDQPSARRLHVLAAGDEPWAAMHARMLEILGRSAVARLFVIVREDCSAVRRRLGAHGYVISSTSWGARLTVTDETLRHLQDQKAGLGRHLLVRELVVDDAAAAHALFSRNQGDFPVTPATEVTHYTVEEMRALIEDQRAFGVWQTERLVALTVLRQRSFDEAETEFTVTERTMRRGGIATALKAHSVWTLAAEGISRFGTGGAQVNEASLKANRRVGYHLEPLWLTYVRLCPTQRAGAVLNRADPTPPCRPAASGLQ